MSPNEKDQIYFLVGLLAVALILAICGAAGV